MKTVILCGDLGTRLAEETQIKPKPMVEIGGRPILWHIMKIYERHGFNEFMLAGVRSCGAPRTPKNASRRLQIEFPPNIPVRKYLRVYASLLSEGAA